MSHEHNGNCCGHTEHHLIEQTLLTAERAGALCCAGQCQHAEHQMAHLFEGQLFDQQRLLEDDSDEETAIDSKKNKKRKKYGVAVGRLAAITTM